MIYLHVIEACLKATIAMLYFCHLKNPANIMKNVFNSISIYSRKIISSPSNKRNEWVIRKMNLFFLTS